MQLSANESFASFWGIRRDLDSELLPKCIYDLLRECDPIEKGQIYGKHRTRTNKSDKGGIKINVNRYLREMGG